MKVPFVDLNAQYQSLKSEMLPAVEKVMETSQFILGKAVSDFEKNFAEAHNMKHCIGVGTGTDALHIILWALGVGPGDEVRGMGVIDSIATAHTCRWGNEVAGTSACPNFSLGTRG